MAKKLPKHKWTKQKDGSYESNYTVKQMNDNNIQPPSDRDYSALLGKRKKFSF